MQVDKKQIASIRACKWNQSPICKTTKFTKIPTDVLALDLICDTKEQLNIEQFFRVTFNLECLRIWATSIVRQENISQ